MRFEIQQVIAGPVEAVARAYTEPGFYERLGDLPKLGRPELLDRQEDGPGLVRLAVRFRFTGQLAPAVMKVVDPAKLSWVEESVHDLERYTVAFRMKPDNYADRLRCDGSSRLEPAAEGRTRRVSVGDLFVRVPLVGSMVEGAIVSGLREHLAAEVAVVEELLGTRGGPE